MVSTSQTPGYSQNPAAPSAVPASPPTRWFRPASLLAAPWLPHSRIERLFADAKLGSRRTDPLFIAIACFACFALGLPMSLVEIGFLSLVFASLAAIAVMPRVYGAALLQPTTLLAVLWAGWQLLGYLWTLDRTLWVDQFGAVRFAGALILLYPLLQRRPLLITFIALGFIAQNLSQFYTGLAHHQEWSVPWRTFPDRNAGWSVPVVGATVLVGALGLHLPAALMGRGLPRLLATAAAALTLLGIIATGTRAAWIGAAAIIIVVALVAILRRRGLAAKLRALGFATALILAVSCVAWFVAGDSLARRANAAWTEVDAALRHHKFDSDNGARIVMAVNGWEAFKQRPIIGIGPGGFRAWSEQHLREANDPDPTRFHQHGHCHNTPLQLLATTGLVGFTLFSLLIASALYGAFANLSHDDLGTYAAGPAFAILGLLTVIPFDVIHVNAQSAALLYFCIALCAPKRPAVIPPTGARQTPAPNPPVPGAGAA